MGGIYDLVELFGKQIVFLQVHGGNSVIDESFVFMAMSILRGIYVFPENFVGCFVAMRILYMCKLAFGETALKP